MKRVIVALSVAAVAAAGCGGGGQAAAPTTTGGTATTGGAAATTTASGGSTTTGGNGGTRTSAGETETCKVATQQEIAGLFERWNGDLKSGDAKKVVTNYAPQSLLLPTMSSRARYTVAEKEDYFVHFWRASRQVSSTSAGSRWAATLPSMRGCTPSPTPPTAARCRLGTPSPTSGTASGG